MILIVQDVFEAQRILRVFFKAVATKFWLESVWFLVLSLSKIVSQGISIQSDQYLTVLSRPFFGTIEHGN